MPEVSRCRSRRQCLQNLPPSTSVQSEDTHDDDPAVAAVRELVAAIVDVLLGHACVERLRNLDVGRGMAWRLARSARATPPARERVTAGLARRPRQSLLIVVEQHLGLVVRRDHRVLGQGVGFLVEGMGGHWSDGEEMDGGPDIFCLCKPRRRGALPGTGYPQWCRVYILDYFGIPGPQVIE